EKQQQRLAAAGKSVEKSESGAHMADGDSFDQTLRRIDDTGKALQARDFGAAREMIEQSIRFLEQLEAETDRRAEQADRFGHFFGNTGRMAGAAKGLHRAGPQPEAVLKDIQQLMPNPDQLLSQEEKRQLNRLSERQGEVKKQTEKIGQELDKLAEELPIV